MTAPLKGVGLTTQRSITWYRKLSSSMEEGVCAELDSVLLELVDCLEELQAARKKYDSAVSEV